MSSKNYDQRLYVQKINLGNNNRRTRSKPKLCPNCKDTSNCVKLFSNKINKIEGIVNDLKNLPQRKADKFSVFKTRFTLNNVPCELEYNLSKFALEDLQKLVIFTTPNCNDNNKYSSSIFNL